MIRLHLTLFLLFSSVCIGQTIDSIASMPVPKQTNWKSKNLIGFDLNDIVFINWNAGGVSSISGLAKGNFTRTYSEANQKWHNELIVRYGVNKQDGIELRKTDDVFQFSSTYGYRKDSLSNWYHSAKFNFNTQFTNGYNYPNTDIAISKPFAPAYTFLGIGAEYMRKEKKFMIYLSPLTIKNTLVLDTNLANQGAFGVAPAIYDSNGNLLSSGKQTRTELGMLVANSFKKELMKNFTMENRLSLYSDYINKFGNIDVDWNIQFELTANDYLKANFGLNLIYDDDIKAKEIVNGQQITVGPKIQLKQMMGIGIVYEFKSKKQ
ncbi:MAG: hypothetical protein RLZ77_17 [Bacteroidota bacterium]|jgi:hypothetical protein